MSRLKSAVDASNDGQLASKLGLSASAYANLKSRGSIPYEKAIALALSHNVNLHWLFTGSDVRQEIQHELVTRSFDYSGVVLEDWQINALEGQVKQFQAINRLMADVEDLQINLRSGGGQPAK
ncbi:MAG: helix-turn-helix domain-containing protein [Burkholderiaceae bacterium]